VGLSVVVCPIASNLTFCSERFLRCHVSHDFGPRRDLEVGSDVVMSYIILNPTSCEVHSVPGMPAHYQGTHARFQSS
jgi:hypothetical protein